MNGLCDELQSEQLKQFVATGKFHADFAVLCKTVGIVPHPAFRLSTSGLEGANGDTGENIAAGGDSGERRLDQQAIAVNSQFLDRPTMEVVRHIIPTSLHLESISFSNCCLDVELLGMLRAGLTDACTITSLRIDWNPLEMPIEAGRVKSIGLEGSLDELEELERQRQALQNERVLRSFCEMLSARFGEHGTALKAVGDHIRPDHCATACHEPLNLNDWTTGFSEVLSLPRDEFEQVFSIMDNPPYGNGDGYVALDHIGKAFEQKLREAGGEPEDPDPLGAAFGAFVDGTSPLEVVSFRCCRLGRLEAESISRSLRTSRHLKALNLWGNRICDVGAASLAAVFEVNFGLQYLGLGRNLITHVGLQSLCGPLGTTRLVEKDKADQVNKAIKEQIKERDKAMKKVEPPKRDAGGRERYTPGFHVDACKEELDPDTGQTYWLWSRNLILTTLNLELNPIGDASSVLQLQPFGIGDLVLRGIPCEEELREAVEALEKAAAEAASDAPAGDAPVDPALESPPPLLSPTRHPGWRLVL